MLKTEKPTMMIAGEKRHRGLAIAQEQNPP